MNIHYNSHMFRNIFQSSFDSCRKFKNILYYSSNLYVFPAKPRKKSTYFQEVFTDSFIANHHDIPSMRQKYQSHQKTFLSAYL